MTRLFDLVITRSCPSGQGLTCRRAVCGGTADAVRCWPVAQDHGRIAAISPNPTLLQAPGLVCVGFRSTVFMKDSATQLRFKCLKAFNVCCDWYSVIVGLLTRFQVKLDRFFFFPPKALILRHWEEIQRIAGWSWMNSASFFSTVMLFIHSQINAWFLLEGFFFFFWKMGKSKNWMQPYIVAILF